MLYMVNKAPLSSDALRTCLAVAAPGEPVLLYEDGVYAAAAGAATAPWVQQALAERPIYALRADLEARGIVRRLDGIQVIDYNGFVSLVEAHNVVPWL
ncbi:MAG TPA: sulfurtransferase complex subunit TusB [Anaerolineae bacterium]|nr:sulfurtransferase complex subunit TusB [Anaerolineae bacterium]HOQ97475.1 sulfurtransferase complex subunit TusB [Anaerolineae bacterium]HPL29649.1 sulfurtransferase complex subunit TusB [Anaerolineae bacterium]